MKFGFKEKKRILLSLIAVLGMGISVSFLLFVDMGSDPYTCMNTGISSTLGLTFGTWQALFNVILLGIVYFSDKSQIGWGTVFNMFLVGYTADFVTWLTGLFVDEKVFGVTYIRITVMIAALALFVISAALYMAAGMGVSPYDALGFIIANKLNKIPFRVSRICMDAFFSVVGYLFGSTIGFVTVIIVLTLGPAIQFMKQKIDVIFS